MLLSLQVMKVSCDHCGQSFDPTQEQESFIQQSARKGMTFIMLQCRNCGLHTAFDPSSERAVGGGESEKKQYRCPLEGCTGWVVALEDCEWGCGECGESFSTSRLFDVIEEITTRYPHRGVCYMPTELGYEPAPPSREPADYADLVSEEGA